MLLLLSWLLLACPGTSPRVRRDSAPSPDLFAPVDWGSSADAPTADGVAPGDLAGGCAPEDAVTACDPIAPSGCSTGAGCYVVKGSYVDCVCPAGTVALGGPCTTTTGCAPGHVCVGDSPPGTCRRACNPTSPTTCAAGETCKQVATMQQYGACSP